MAAVPSVGEKVVIEAHTASNILSIAALVYLHAGASDDRLLFCAGARRGRSADFVLPGGTGHRHRPLYAIFPADEEKSAGCCLSSSGLFAGADLPKSGGMCYNQ